MNTRIGKKAKVSISLSLVVLLMAAMMLPGAYVASALPSGSTEIVDMTVNYQATPLGIETDNLRFGWKMDSNIIGQGQQAYQIVVKAGKTDGPVVWDSGQCDSGISVSIPYGGDTSVFQPETRYYWKVTVADVYGQQHTATSYFETGANWGAARWITKNGFLGATSNTFTYSATNMNALMFRREEALQSGAVESARLYITGLGTYQAYINGKNVFGDKKTMMAPGWTAYTDYVTYQTYDVTDYIDGDSVALSALVGTGFYDGRNANATTGVFRNASNATTNLRERCLLAKLVIKYKDGSTQEIITEPGNAWQVSGRTPVTMDGLGRGENYDGRIAKEFAGWNDVNYTPASTTTGNWSGAVAMNYTGFSGVIGDDRGVPKEYARLPWVDAYVYQDWTGMTFSNNTCSVTNLGDILPGWSTSYNANIRNTNSPYRSGTIDESKLVRYQPGAAEIVVPAGKTLVLDFGQNASGVPDLTLSGNAGVTLLIQNGENVSDGNSTVTTDTAGWTPRGRPIPKGVVQYEGGAGSGKRFQYILGGSTAGNPERYMAEHHFVGFRYLAITPTGGDIIIYNAESVAFTSVGKETGFVETSNPMVDQFVQNSKWSQVGNYVSVPTDCPTREYNGWLGDAQVFAETAMYHFDTSGTQGYFIDIMQKGSQQITRNNATRIGYYADTMPTTGTGSRGPGWTDGGVIVPWQFYRATGDKSVMEMYWKEMCDYADALNAAIRYNENGTGTWTTGYTGASNSGTGWGDHLGVYIPTGQFTATVMQLNVNITMENMARALGKTADIIKYSDRVTSMKTYMKNRYIDPVTGDVRSGRSDDTQGSNGFAWAPYTKVNNAQTALAWMLIDGVYDTEAQRDIMAANLAKSIANDNRAVNPKLPENSISAGFLGVNALMPALSKGGMSDTAYALLTSTDRYSFLFGIAQAPVPATTIWEEWVLWGDNDGSAGGTNMTGAEGWGKGSQNHYSYGASSTWLYQYMLGIEKDDENPGYKNMILQPTPNAALDYAKGSYESYYGAIRSGWTLNAGGELATYSCTVTPNTTATLYLPIDAADAAGFANIPGVAYLGMTAHNGLECAEFNLLSGGYDFKVTADGLVASYADGYVVPDVLYEAVLAKIHANEDSVILNSTASYTVSLSEAKGLGVFELSFKFDGEILDKDSITITPKNGFTLHLLEPAPVFTYLGSGLWKCTVKFMYFNNVITSDQLDAFVISGKAIDYGPAVVTLTGFSAQGDNGAGMGAMISLIHTPEATVIIGAKPPEYSKYDLNKDGVIDEIDLLYLIYFYQWNDRDPGWATDDLYGVFAQDCDFQVNGKVDLADMIELTANYGPYDPYAW